MAIDLKEDSGVNNPPTALPARRFRDDMSTVTFLASVFGDDGDKIARGANMRSQLEWGMDMEWLDEMSERWNLPAAHRDDLESKFRARHREFWGKHAYQGD